MTILRDRETSRGDFIFYTDRLATLIVEKALTLIRYEPKQIQTPLKLPYRGSQQASKVSAAGRRLTIALMGVPGSHWRCYPPIGWTVLAGPAPCDP